MKEMLGLEYEELLKELSLFRKRVKEKIENSEEREELFKKVENCIDIGEKFEVKEVLEFMEENLKKCK